MKERVLADGHSIPPEDIDRRFPKSLRNLLVEFSEMADRTRCFINDSKVLSLIYTQTIEGREIAHDDYYAQLVKQAK